MTKQSCQSCSIFLYADSLSRTPGKTAAYRINSPEDTGTSGGEFCIMWLGPDWPVDQRHDDAHVLAFDTDIIDHPLTFFGASEITLALEADHPHGNVIVRLCDVAADGTGTLITYGVLNLAHHHSHENPQPMTPNCRETIHFKLDDCGYIVPIGHRLRVAISTAH